MRLPVRLPVRGRSRILLAVTVVVLAAVGSTGAWLLLRDASEAASSTTMTVSSQTVQQTVSADGTIAALRSADESFAVSGTVTRVLVAEGDTVTKGQALARVDDEALVATRTAAVSSLDAALEQLDTDEDDGASDVQLADARAAVSDATLRASIAGTVTSVGLTAGETVGSGSGGNGGSSPSSSPSSSDTSSDGAISIVSTKAFAVDATVAASDVKQVKKGLQAQITATGVQDTVYGTVSSVGLVAQTNDSGAAVFPVTIAVTGTPEDLYVGVSATVSIIVKQVDDVLTVASRALTTDDGKTYVTKLVGGKKVRTAVEIGETYGMSTEVVSGLADGDQVVVPGFTGFGGSTGRGSGEGGRNGLPGGGRLPQVGQGGGR